MSHSIILSRQESRELDRQAIEEFAIPSIVLMENAGRSITDFLLSQYTTGDIVICCGKGNNAGDGFVVARHLDNHNIPVRILLFAPPEELKGDAKINYSIVIKSEIPMIFCNPDDNLKIQKELANAGWIIDAIFGTGLVGEIKSPFDTIIQLINSTSAKILSIDIPSGLDCDTGTPLGAAIKAQFTATCATLKKGFLNPEAAEFLGHIHVVDIGVPKDYSDKT